VLRTRLFGSGQPTYLRTEIDGDGRPLPGAGELVSHEPPWWPAAKLFGRHLSPWMAHHAAAVPLAA
jgi:hypothetical protein